MSVCLTVCLFFASPKKRPSDLLHTWQKPASAVSNLVQFRQATCSILDFD